jgi:ribonuclease T1
MRLPRTRSQWLAALLVLVVVGALWLWENRSPGVTPPADQPSAVRTDGTAPEKRSVDPETGLAVVPLEDLPPEAEETVELIEDGGPFPYDRDGVTFENREGILPDRERGYYEEYTVPTPGEDDRGARRIVTGDDDEYFWTPDHYESFVVIER